MNIFKDAAGLVWDNSPDANEPSWAVTKATNLFNKWVSQCAISGLGPQQQSTLLIWLIVEALEEKATDYWGPTYKEQILLELSEAIEMLERVRDWYDAHGVRYIIRDDVDALLARLKR